MTGSDAQTPPPWEQWVRTTARPVELPRSRREARHARRSALDHLPRRDNGQPVIVGPMPSNAPTKSCDEGRHDRCNHRLGAAYEGGIVLKLSLPGFLCRCGCLCHNDPLRA